MSDFAWKERVVVVTGAGSGIGAEIVRAVARRGGSSVLIGRRVERLEEVQRSLDGGAGAGGSLVCPADMTRRGDVARTVSAALARFGRVDAWVNNAGRGITRTVEQLTDDDLDAMIRDNVKSALYGMQAILPHFKERRRGHIMNVSSLLGRIPFVGFRSAYSAAKHALNSLTENLRGDLAKDFPDIVVSSLVPGVVATDFGLNALHGGQDSRTFPGAQSAEEVAAIAVDAIEAHRNGDVYTHADGLDRVLHYLRGLA